jgi:hypothetical protein
MLSVRIILIYELVIFFYDGPASNHYEQNKERIRRRSRGDKKEKKGELFDLYQPK